MRRDEHKWQILKDLLFLFYYFLHVTKRLIVYYHKKFKLLIMCVFLGLRNLNVKSIFFFYFFIYTKIRIK